MARSIASLAVSVVAKTIGFERGLKRVQRKFSRLTREIKRAAIKTAAVTSAAFAAIAGVGITALVKRSFEAIDATAKLSDRLNIAVEDITALQRSAQLTGATNEELAKGLELMTRNIGDARVGIGETKDELERLGLANRQFFRLKPIQQFRVLADRIAKMDYASQKASTAARIFGRSGVKLVNVLQQGSAAIEEQKKEAIKLGIAFSRIDAANVEELKDRLNDAKLVLRAIGNNILPAIVPQVVLLSEKVASSAEAFKAFGAAAETAFLTAGRVGASVLVLLQDLHKRILETGNLYGIKPFTRTVYGPSGRPETVTTLEGEAYQRLMRAPNAIDKFEQDILNARNRIERKAGMKIQDQRAAQKKLEADIRLFESTIGFYRSGQRAVAPFLHAGGGAVRNLGRELGDAFRYGISSVQRYQRGDLAPVAPGGLTPKETAIENKDRAERRQFAQRVLYYLDRLQRGGTLR